MSSVNASAAISASSIVGGSLRTRRAPHFVFHVVLMAPPASLIVRSNQLIRHNAIVARVVPKRVAEMLQRSNRFQERVDVFPLAVNLGAEFQNPPPRSR